MLLRRCWHHRVLIVSMRRTNQVLSASHAALMEFAAPLERWQADTAALLDDLGARLAAPRMPPAAAIACQVCHQWVTINPGLPFLYQHILYHGSF